MASSSWASHVVVVDGGAGSVAGDDIVAYKGTARRHPREECSVMLADGHGRATFRDGRVYEGEFLLGMCEGFGIMRYPDGTIFEGTWEADQPSGYGVLDGPTCSYSGIFRGGEKHGQGEERLNNGEVYSGTFKGGMRHGVGRLLATDGSIIDGPFDSGVLHGLATVTYPNGDTLVGRFADGFLEGQCEYTQQSSGDVYTDEYVRGQCVQGVMCDPPLCEVRYPSTGCCYRGGWERTGAGPDRAGRREGHGRLTFPNGDCYDGEFSSDHMEGHGVVTYATTAQCSDEPPIDDEYGGNDMMDSRRNTTAFDARTVPISSSSSVEGGGGEGGSTTAIVQFRGDFHEGLRDGRGYLFTADGRVLEGFWSKGRRHGVFHETTSLAAEGCPPLPGDLRVRTRHLCFDHEVGTQNEADAMADHAIRLELQSRYAVSRHGSERVP